MRKPIRYNFDDGQFLYASLDCDKRIRVDIQFPDGSLFADWSLPVSELGLDPREFVARTWGDTRGLMASAMLGTGWFIRTGQEVTTSSGECNEIWRLSDLGVEWAAAVSKQSRVVIQ